MAHFSLETDPFLSMEILVAKEVLEWNHLSVSYSVNWRYLRSFSTSHLWMICPQESSRNREIGSKKKSFTILHQHLGSFWGHTDLLVTNLWCLGRAKPQTAWWQAYHLCSSQVRFSALFFCCKNGPVPHPGSFPGQTPSPRTLQWWKVANAVWYQFNSMHSRSLSEH